MNKQSVIKNRMVIVVLLALIIGLPSRFFVSYYLARASYPSGATPVFEHPIGSYSYLIFNDGGTYYAKNGSVGTLDYSGTNASQVAINSIGSGGRTIVFAPDATYEFTSRILVQNNTSLFGYGATLKWTGAVIPSGIVWDGSVWEVVGVTVRTWKEGVTVAGFTFDGNLLGMGIHFERLRRSTVRDNTFLNSLSNPASADILWGHGAQGNVIENNRFFNSRSQATIYLTGGLDENSGVFDTVITKNFAYNYTGRGIILEGFGYQERTKVTFNTMQGRNDSSSNGIEVMHWSNLLIQGNTFRFNYHGISIAESPSGFGVPNNVIISENLVEYNYWHGIYLNNVTNAQISDNTIRDNNQGLSGGTPSGISLYDTINSTIIGNQIYRSEAQFSQRYGISEDGIADYNVIVGVTTRNNYIAGIFIIGANTQVNLCWNNTVWIP